jgi:hypothetical protein
MALTAQEKHDTIRLLGWTAKVLEVNSLDYNTIVNDRLNTIPVEGEESLRLLLIRLVGLDAKLDKALCRVSTLEIGDIKLNPEEIRLLRNERRRLIKELSELTGIAFVSMIGSNSVSVCV